MNIVIVNCFDTYEHRVELLYDFFRKQGDNVKVYTSNYRHIAKTIRNEEKNDFTFIQTRPYNKNLSVDRLRSHSEFARNVFVKLEEENIDLLWVMIPPNSVAKHAVNYKNKHNLKLVFDLIDLWPETMPMNAQLKKVFVFKLWQKLRDDYLDYADLVVTECNLYQNSINRNVSQNKLETLYLARNLKRIEQIEGLANNEIALCYLGSINNIIDIPMISHIISELSEVKPVTIHIIGDGEKREELITVAENAGAKVDYHGVVYDDAEKKQIMSKCHYGLNVMKNTVKVGLTMKSMDYFEAGIPILNTIQGDTWEFCEKMRIGINIDKSEWEYRALNEIFKREDIHEFANKMFSKEAFEKKMIKIYQKVLQ